MLKLRRLVQQLAPCSSSATPRSASCARQQSAQSDAAGSASCGGATNGCWRHERTNDAAVIGLNDASPFDRQPTDLRRVRVELTDRIAAADSKEEHRILEMYATLPKKDVAAMKRREQRIRQPSDCRPPRHITMDDRFSRSTETAAMSTCVPSTDGRQFSSMPRTSVERRAAAAAAAECNGSRQRMVTVKTPTTTPFTMEDKFPRSTATAAMSTCVPSTDGRQFSSMPRTSVERRAAAAAAECNGSRQRMVTVKTPTTTPFTMEDKFPRSTATAAMSTCVPSTDGRQFSSMPRTSVERRAAAAAAAECNGSRQRMVTVKTPTTTPFTMEDKFPRSTATATVSTCVPSTDGRQFSSMPRTSVERRAAAAAAAECNGSRQRMVTVKTPTTTTLQSYRVSR
jgi:hypothetical protein